MPTAFRPKSDIISNKKFKPVNKISSDLIVYEIYIYDQWGNQLFHSKDMDDGWDGTFRGKDMPDGVYVYKIEAYETMFGTDLSKVGSFVLVP